MDRPRTSSPPAARWASLRGAARRYLSPVTGVALGAELVLAIIEVAAPHATFVVTAYVVPVLAVAVVSTAERTAVVAVTAVLLAVLGGVWNDNFGTGLYLYRLGIVAGGGVLAVLGAMFREQAVRAHDRMALLARIGEIADGSGQLDSALRRLAAALVPVAADRCELVVFEDERPRLVVVRGPGDADAIVSEAPDDREAASSGALAPGVAAAASNALTAARAGDGVLLDHLHGPTPGGEPDVGADAERLRAAGMNCALYVPVRAADEVLAVLILAVGPSRRRYEEEDLRFARTVGSRAALAIQNSRLLFEVREAQLRMEAIVGSLADAVTIREPSGKLVYANDAALRSMDLTSVQELRDSDPEALFNQFIVTDERGGPLKMADLPSVKLLAGEEPQPLLLRFVHRASGEEHWSLLKATPLYDTHGQLEAAVTVIEDVTTSKRAEVRSTFLSRSSEVLAASLDYEETLRNVAWLAVPEVADWCAVDLIDEDGARQRVVTAHRDPAKVELAKRLREYEPEELDPKTGLGAVLRTGEPALYHEIRPEQLERTARNEEHLALVREVNLRSAVIVPMRAGKRMVGAMTLVNAESGRRFREDDVNFAEQIAARAAVAVENSRLYSERSRIAATLQQSLLPEALPSIEGWEVASLYRPASVDGSVEVGGDFYDAFSTEGGWVMLIGDVTGKGVEAAAMTSLVRHGARFVAEYVPDPSQVLARVDRALRGESTLSLCTALCLRIEGDRVTFASAGHPPPLLVTDDGVSAVGKAGPVLGAFPDGEWPAHELVLGPEEVLLLYTDGVTDTVGHAERFGEQRLCRTMAECGPVAPEDLLQCLEKALSKFQVGAQADDTAALALRLSGEPRRPALSGLERHAGG